MGLLMQRSNLFDASRFMQGKRHRKQSLQFKQILALSQEGYRKTIVLLSSYSISHCDVYLALHALPSHSCMQTIPPGIIHQIISLFCKANSAAREQRTSVSTSSIHKTSLLHLQLPHQFQNLATRRQSLLREMLHLQPFRPSPSSTWISVAGSSTSSSSSPAGTWNSGLANGPTL